MANALWGQKGFDFLPDFLKLVKDNYGAGLSELDFVKDTEGSRKTINDWVEKQTQDKIKELLKPGMLVPGTRLVLTNAIYFKSSWADQFNKEATKDEPFHLAGGNDVKAPLMHRTGHYGYFEEDTLQGLKLPYAGNELSMVVLLPKKADGLADLEKALTAEKLDGWMKKFGGEKVIVALPKFKTTSEFNNMEDQLQALGMKVAFSGGAADFSGMDGKKDLFISKVVHKAFVDVNEEGTEAAAATAVIMAGSARRGARAAQGLQGRPPVPLPHPAREDRGDPLHGPRGRPHKIARGSEPACRQAGSERGANGTTAVQDRVLARRVSDLPRFAEKCGSCAVGQRPTVQIPNLKVH